MARAAASGVVNAATFALRRAIHAMAGFRIGHAIVPEGGPDLRPVLGVGAPALTGALWAVEHRAEPARRRRMQADAQRARLAAEFDVAPGAGPYVWLRAAVADELAALEDEARSRGVTRMKLETGDRQPEAIAMYERAGYARCPCWGAYALARDFVCFTRALR